MRRRLAVIGAAVLGVATLSLASVVNAVVVDPSTKSCLNKTIGVKAANKIIAAKKLTAAQNKQLAKCKSSSAGAGGSASAPAGSTTSTSSDMVSLNYGLLSYKTSQRDGLGNISDPALLQVGSTLRMFFKNGNEPQIPLAGFDNKIHSYISTDNGVTWTLESGVRVDVGSPITVRAAEAGGYEAWAWSGPGSGGEVMSRYSSSDGKDFAKGSGSAVSVAACKSADGAAASLLGDPQVVKVASGYLAYSHDMAANAKPPFKRHACAMTSPDGVTWSLDVAQTFAPQNDVQTNPETYRNAAGVIEQIFPIDKISGSGSIQSGMQIRTSTNDGATWSALNELSFFAADPERLDLSNGDSLLAFGNFDHRQGGLLAVSKKISTGYKASRSFTMEKIVWTISGTTKANVVIKNLCLDKDLTSSTSFTTSGSNVVATFSDPAGRGNGCVYALIGPEKAIK